MLTDAIYGGVNAAVLTAMNADLSVDLDRMAAHASWLLADGDGVILRLHVQPGAKTTEVAGLHGDALKIKLAAPPVDGKANAELIELVARQFGCAKSAVSIKSGAGSKLKRVVIPD